MCFLNLFNEFYSCDTSKKVKAVKKACAENGKFVGTYPPYGYKRDPEDKHHFVVDEDTAPIVRRIFAMRASGMGYYSIAAALNDEGIQSPRESYYQQRGQNNPQRSINMWSNTTVKTLLQNEAYIGNLVQGKFGNMSYKHDASRWVEIIRRYTGIESLDETILFELVDRIEIGEMEKREGVCLCKIKVFEKVCLLQ